eukprot:gene21557-biopygen11678
MGFHAENSQELLKNGRVKRNPQNLGFCTVRCRKKMCPTRCRCKGIPQPDFSGKLPQCKDPFSPSLPRCSRSPRCQKRQRLKRIAVRTPVRKRRLGRAVPIKHCSSSPSWNRKCCARHRGTWKGDPPRWGSRWGENGGAAGAAPGEIGNMAAPQAPPRKNGKIAAPQAPPQGKMGKCGAAGAAP